MNNGQKIVKKENKQKKLRKLFIYMHLVSISLNKKLLQKLLKYKIITCHSIEKSTF